MKVLTHQPSKSSRLAVGTALLWSCSLLVSTTQGAEIIVDNFRVQALSPTLVRVEPKGPVGFEDRTSFMVVNNASTFAGIPIHKTSSGPNGTLLTTPNYQVLLQGNATPPTPKVPTCASPISGFDVSGPARSDKYAEGVKVADEAACCAACSSDSTCRMWVFAPPSDNTNNNDNNGNNNNRAANHHQEDDSLASDLSSLDVDGSYESTASSTPPPHTTTTATTTTRTRTSSSSSTAAAIDMVVEHSPHPTAAMPFKVPPHATHTSNSTNVAALHEANLSVVKHFRLSIDLRSVTGLRQASRVYVQFSYPQVCVISVSVVCLYVCDYSLVRIR